MFPFLLVSVIYIYCIFYCSLLEPGNKLVIILSDLYLVFYHLNCMADGWRLTRDNHEDCKEFFVIRNYLIQMSDSTAAITATVK